MNVHYRHRAKTRPSYAPGWHLNTKWSLEDIALVQTELARGVRPKQIAEIFSVPTSEITALIARNKIAQRGWQ